MEKLFKYIIIRLKFKYLILTLSILITLLFSGVKVYADYVNKNLSTVIESSSETSNPYDHEENINDITFEEYSQNIDDIYIRLFADLVSSPTKHIYDNYYENFVGLYYDNEVNEYITVIANPIPNELQDYIDSHSFSYIIVDNSLHELIEVEKAVGYDSLNDSAFSGISINIYSNKVHLYVTDENFDFLQYQEFIDNGTLEIIIREPVITY